MLIYAEPSFSMLFHDLFVLVLNIHLCAVKEDLSIHLRFYLLDRHFWRQTDIESFTYWEIEILFLSNAVKYLMLDCLINTHTLSWIEYQRFLKEVLPIRKTVIEYLTRFLLLIFGQRFQVVKGDLFLNKGNFLCRRRSNNLKDFGTKWDI